MTAPAAIGHNSQLEGRQHELLETGKQWFDRYPEIDTQEVSDICSDYISQVRAFKKEVESSRKAQKAPVIEQGKAIEAYYKGLTADLATIEAALKERQTTFLKIGQDRLAQERREAEERARKEHEAAEEAARKLAESQSFDDMKQAEDAQGRADDAQREADEAASKRATAKGDLAPRSMSLRTSYSAEIVNYDLALEHYRNHSNVREAIQAIANGEARHTKGTMNVPGVKVITTQQAV